jgi:hypothetical protein
VCLLHGTTKIHKDDQVNFVFKALINGNLFSSCNRASNDKISAISYWRIGKSKELNDLNVIHMSFLDRQIKNFSYSSQCFG